MTEPEAYQLILKIGRIWSITIASDLAQVVSQRTKTTKLDRRARALAYLIENLTGSSSFTPTEEVAVEMVNLIEAVRHNYFPGQEGSVALDRADKRLRDGLAYGEYSRLTPCQGCGEMRSVSGPHECTNLSSRMKDITMSRDPDLL